MMRKFFMMCLLAAPLLYGETLALAKKPHPATPAPAAPVAPPPAAPAPQHPTHLTVVAPPVVQVRPQPVITQTVRVQAPPQVVIEAPPPQVVYQPYQTVTVQAPPIVEMPVPVENAYPPPPPGPSCMPMHENGLHGIIGAIQAESFSSGQLRVLADAAQGRCFHVAQVAQILPLYTFEDDKLKALEIMSGGLMDRHNAFRIYSLFTFEASKDRARQILAR